MVHVCHHTTLCFIQFRHICPLSSYHLFLILSFAFLSQCKNGKSQSHRLKKKRKRVIACWLVMKFRGVGNSWWTDLLCLILCLCAVCVTHLHGRIFHSTHEMGRVEAWIRTCNSKCMPLPTVPLAFCVWLVIRGPGRSWWPCRALCTGPSACRSAGCSGAGSSCAIPAAWSQSLPLRQTTWLYSWRNRKKTGTSVTHHNIWFNMGGR